jgi:hypothetical protein
MGTKLIGTNPGPMSTPAPLMAEAKSTPEVVRDRPASGAEASPHAVRVVRTAAALVIGALVLLWFLGGIVFKNANL